jgi:MFS family permease
VIFLSPEAFALTNLFSTIGADFGASERAVTTLNGPMVAVACSLGCLLAIPLCRVWRRRTVYIMAGVGSAVCAVALGVLPHTVMIYGAGLLAYNFCQGFNYASFTALELEIIGPQNALSGTLMAMLTASSNVPISSMTYLDGRVHDSHGLRAMLFTDAGASVLTAVVLLAVVLPLLDRMVRRGVSARA